QVAVDPALGRIAFSPRSMPRKGVWVTYHYGFSADMGGGEYNRRPRPAGDRHVYYVTQPPPDAASRPAVQPPPDHFETIGEALAHWTKEKATHRDVVIEITDGGLYSEPIEILLDPEDRLELRAANLQRPVIRLPESYTNRPSALHIARADEAPQEKRGGHLRLDGLLIAGSGLQIEGHLKEVTIRHCTLVPGWSLDAHCHPQSEAEPSIELFDTTARLVIERSILGSIEVNDARAESDPAPISISDSIVDAQSSKAKALHAPDCAVAHAALRIVRCTVFGRVQVHQLDLAENCIFTGEVKVARRQQGCVRFCYVPRGSVTPRRYDCQPDNAIAAMVAGAQNTPVPESDKARVADQTRPIFNDVRYGKPAYAQLADACPASIKRGADDESEMGAFHDLFQPQREANLRARLDEFTPAGLDAGLFFET
ncbi:MAG TPA: hypothetical protein VGZ22_22720, partial [Isosphaeraceae bacterium]|nr:hypothetical protein [Isosphaeraceae bacterium]